MICSIADRLLIEVLPLLPTPESSCVARRQKQHPICLLDPTARTKKVEVKCYGNILGEYRNHPEAKFLGPDGIPCHSQTSGLLQRSEIVVERIRYIGKETSRRWEQGEDLSMVDFSCTEYSAHKVIADQEIRTKIPTPPPPVHNLPALAPCLAAHGHRLSLPMPPSPAWLPSSVPLLRALEANPETGLLPPRYQYALSGNFFKKSFPG